MTHRYHYVLDEDGDYIVWESAEGEHCRWMIPGTHFE